MEHDCVKIANMLACRFSLICILCLVREIFWCGEQPSSTVALFLPYLETVMNANIYLRGFPAALIQKLLLVRS